MFIFPEKSVTTILNNHSSPLNKLFGTANKMALIEQQLAPLLDEPLKSHVRVYQLKMGCLTLAVDSAHWAFKLKFTTSNLLSALRKTQALAGITQIKIQVAPIKQPQAARTQRKVECQQIASPEGAAALRGAADCQADTALQEALRTLAEHVDSSNK